LNLMIFNFHYVLYPLLLMYFRGFYQNLFAFIRTVKLIISILHFII